MKHLIILILLSSNVAFAQTESSIEGNMIYYSGADSAKTKLGNPGYGLKFKTGPDKEWLRPVYGASLERGQGAAGVLTAGNLFLGASLAHKVGSRVAPFISTDAILGWGNYSGTTTNDNGFIYGGMISAGAEIAFKNGDQNRFALLITTGYRLLYGSIGALGGADISAFVLGVGFAWSDDSGGGRGGF